MGDMSRMTAFFLNLLVMSSLASAGFLFPRQGSTTSSALPTSSSSIPEDDDPSDPNRPTLATSTDTSSNMTDATASSILPSSTSTSNATNTNTTDLNPTITSNPTPLNSTNDPSACHLDFDASNGEFENILCVPEVGALIPTNKTYTMTWDPAIFPSGSNITISLHLSNSSMAPQDAWYNSTDIVSALKGSAWVDIPTTTLKGYSRVNATVTLLREGGGLAGEGEGDEQTYVGPWVEVYDPAKGNGTAINGTDDAATNGGGGSGGGKKLGEEVGIPIGLLAFLAVLAAGIFFVLRRRKTKSGDYLARRKSQNGGSARGGGGLVGPHRRTESFHDEPMMGGGVELQNTRSSRAYSGASSVSRLSEGDSWGWGSPGGGVSTTVTGGGGGNVFREELGRQQTGRGY